MSQNHPAIIYSTYTELENRIIDFFEKGMSENERCVFLTTQNDAQKIFDRLCSVKGKSKVVKLFSYFFIPDPKMESERFRLKMESLKKMVLNENFQGRVAFNVLGDMSRFSIEDISNIEKVEKYLHQISSNKLKLFCSFKMESEGENVSKMIKMAMSTHDHIIFEKEGERQD